MYNSGREDSSHETHLLPKGLLDSKMVKLSGNVGQKSKKTELGIKWKIQASLYDTGGFLHS